MDRPADRAPRVSAAETVTELLADWTRQTHRELSAVTEIDAGGSGGVLVSAYVRELDPGRQGGRMIIKVLGPSEETVGEPGQHKAALIARTEGNKDFVDQHLVGLGPEPHKVDGTWVMFQLPAGDEDAVTLAGVDRRRLPHLAARIVAGVLAGWNPEDPQVVERTAAEFVADILDRRLDPEGPLLGWVRGRLLARPAEPPWVSLPGGDRPVPNPLNLGAGSDLARYQLDVPQRGRAHGDLHPGNIMVPRQPAAGDDDFVLIDLSRFAPDALLARDPAHLLLCLVAGYLPHLDDEARAELIPGLLRAPCDGTLVPQGLAALVATVHAAWLDWGVRHRIQRDWRRQWYLAVQGCALMFLGRKGYSDRDRWWFFQLAAEACGAYLDEMGVRRPHDAPLVALDPAVEPVPVAPAAPVAPATAPPPPDRPAGDPDPLLGLLQKIEQTYETPMRQLTAADPALIPLESAMAIRLHALTFRTELRAASAANYHALDVRPVRDALRVVAMEAQVTEAMLARGETFRSGPVLRDLVSALDDLLDAVAAARRDLLTPAHP
ncbi:hypothetical protein [Streptomyces flavalbus]|uniref:Aminoglycoside phosphotransferase domain-containing protein n=1 Tax=Streptomyces flavalbus TaxID=2665155 RepID=A0ABW2WG63_9ACTN